MAWPYRSSLLALALQATAFQCMADALPGSAGPAFVPIAEEVLDLAIEHCQRGQATQAMALFAAIREQLDPPPAILELILGLEREGCRGSTRTAGQWELRLVTGYDDNVSQGIRATSLTLGPSTAPIELVIDDSYKPLGSAFAEMAAERTWQLGDDLSLHLKAGGRHYSLDNNYDLASASAMVKSRITAWERPVELLGDWTELWFGGRHYHTAWTVAAQASVAQQAPQWYYSALIQKISYYTQPEQDSMQYQVGLNRLFAGRSKVFMLGVSGTWDDALGQRAGGNRAGFNLHATAQTRLQPWLLTARLNMTRWASRQDFLSGLVDEKRRNTLVQAGLQAEYPLAANQSLQLDLLVRNSRDTIALYAYRSYTLTISWAGRF